LGHGGAIQRLPEGVWGMPPEMLRNLPGYDPKVAKNRAQAEACAFRSIVIIHSGGR
jgi:hypothetical protein